MIKQIFFLTSIFGALNLQAASTKEPEIKVAEVPEYKVKDFKRLIDLKIFSEKLLKMHFTLYSGYVKNTNLLANLLKNTPTQDYAYQALKRRFGFEFNGMRLHELYFENLGGKKLIDPSSSLHQKIVADFGSFEAWKADFIATGGLRGVGWAILYLDPIENRLFNTWISDHELGHLSTGVPMLVMDVWEHAYMPEFDLDRSEYIKKFFDAIDWSVVLTRYQDAQ